MRVQSGAHIAATFNNTGLTAGGDGAECRRECGELRAIGLGDAGHVQMRVGKFPNERGAALQRVRRQLAHAATKKFAGERFEVARLDVGRTGRC